MPRALRAEQFDSNEVCIVHLVQRCVRRAYLAGVDPVSGKDFEFRREWIRARMECLASVFGIDVLTYAILSNHIHLVIRNRPDVVGCWSDREVAIRWLRVFPGRRLDNQLAEPTEADVNVLVGSPDRLKIIRTRLSDPSWFMRALSEPIARLANMQDECTGHFWEGRFKAQRIVDEAGLLACSMYVDLNPIRAAMTTKVEESVHTSAYDRIKALKGDTIASAAADLVVVSNEEAGKKIRTQTVAALKRERKLKRRGTGKPILRDAWLAPLCLGSKIVHGSQTKVAQVSASGVRASDRGFLSFKLEEYLKLLDWTGRMSRAGVGTAGITATGKVPADLAPILQRLGIEGSMWCDLVWNFKKYFGRGGAAGTPKSLKEHATRNDRKFQRGQSAASDCFAEG